MFTFLYQNFQLYICSSFLLSTTVFDSRPQWGDRQGFAVALHLRRSPPLIRSEGKVTAPLEALHGLGFAVPGKAYYYTLINPYAVKKLVFTVFSPKKQNLRFHS